MGLIVVGPTNGSETSWSRKSWNELYFLGGGIFAGVWIEGFGMRTLKRIFCSVDGGLGERPAIDGVATESSSSSSLESLVR